MRRRVSNLPPFRQRELAVLQERGEIFGEHLPGMMLSALDGQGS
jgi:hypothetical protein